MLCRQKTGFNSSSVKSAVRREDEAIQTELATGRQTENRHVQRQLELCGNGQYLIYWATYLFQVKVVAIE